MVILSEYEYWQKQLGQMFKGTKGLWYFPREKKLRVLAAFKI